MKAKYQLWAAIAFTIVATMFALYDIAVFFLNGGQHNTAIIIHIVASLFLAALSGCWWYRIHRYSLFMKYVDRYFGNWFVDEVSSEARNLHGGPDLEKAFSHLFWELWGKHHDLRFSALKKARSVTRLKTPLEYMEANAYARYHNQAYKRFVYMHPSAPDVQELEEEEYE